jgi:S-adenosyl-L-methionine hydrolase (adenosine-forming)
MGLVTLLTDFGLRDAYGAIVKGAIAQVNPGLQIIDLTHQIPPQDVATARFQLMNAYPYFPEGTVHVAIVDPGVGSRRRAIAVQLESGFLVSPDNGLVSGVLSQNRAIAAVELTHTRYWRVASPSLTFHGRDIFATVAAHLASGVPLLDLGTAIEIESIISLPIAPSLRVNHTIRGSIQAIDHFGNLITTIPGSEVEGKVWSVKIADLMYRSSATYSDGEVGEILALVGSHGWVEIAANRDNAQMQLGVDWGSSIEVVLREE